MANISQTFGESASTNRPPLFAGENYPFWKIGMKIFFESIDKDVWDVVINGPYGPTKIENGKTGQLKKVTEHTMMKGTRTSFPLHQQLMNFIEFLHVNLQKKCGMFLRSHIRGLMK